MATKIVQVEYTGAISIWNPDTQSIDTTGLNPDFATLDSLAMRMFISRLWQEVDGTGLEIILQPQIYIIYDDSNETALFASLSTINECTYFSYELSSYATTAIAAVAGAKKKGKN
jgi:hypothetical protein